MLWLILLSIVGYLIYLTVVKPMSYWKNRGIPCIEPRPIVGNFGASMLRKKSFLEVIEDLYKKFPEKRYYGIYSFTRPQLLIRDPELIKRITVKDFDHFINRTEQIPENVEPLFAKNLVSLKSQKWRHMRATLSPSFTSSKMRFMFELITDCAKQLTDYFEKQGSEVIEVEVKDVYSRFTNDVIATVAFGVSVDSLKDRENEFFLMGKDVSNFGGLRALKFFGYSVIPTIMKFFKINIFPQYFNDFIRRIIKETIDARQSQGIVRPDMIHLLLEARKGKNSQDEEHTSTDAGFAVVEESETTNNNVQNSKNISDDDIAAQAMIFFFAGFETVSTLISFMSHELAIATDVQKRLQQEIDEVLEKNKKVSYEDVLGLKYLDMVVSEALRKWSPGVALDRVCAADYTIPAELPGEKSITIKKGESLMIPILGIHRDPKYFPNPDKFDPERFSDENKSKISPYVYIPFGSGPRNCIASRFALMETKILAFNLLSKFEIVPTAKTCIPLVLSRTKLTMSPDEGFWLGLKLRKSV